MIRKILAFQIILVLFVFSLAALASAEEELPYVRTVFNERNGLPPGEANDVLMSG